LREEWNSMGELNDADANAIEWEDNFAINKL